ncbi:hypothetical protein HY389_02175 [Candidatus Daviesbacteria bacterium]|nr:hypothetical protein [Candidatus Daviesbacteria bacterium]
MSAPRFLLLAGLLTLLIFLALPKISYAALNPDDYKAPQNAQYSLMNLIHGSSCLLGGFSNVTSQANGSPKCLSYNADGSLQALTYTPDGGALGGLGTLVAEVYANPPISTREYLADVGSNLGLINKAQAQSVQGSGSGVLKPVLEIWVITRNIAYLAFILIFIIVGFMIMFRQKLNPQTVVTVQAALPGLVIGLILVTFSYFLSSLLVDLAFIGMQLVASLFPKASAGILDPHGLAQYGNVFDMVTNFVLGSGGAAVKAGQLFLSPPQGADTKELILNIFRSIPYYTTILPLIAAGGILIPTIVSIVVLIALVIQAFRVLWALITAYITILIVVIFAPFIILAASLPGQGGRLSAWWKTLLANILIFPAVFAGFLFAGFLMSRTGQFGTVLPLFSGLPVDVMGVILGIGVFLSIPAIPGAVKKALGTQDQGAFGKEAMFGVGAGVGFGKTAVVDVGFNRFWRGGAKPGQPPEGGLAKWAENRGFYRPTAGQTKP